MISSTSEYALRALIHMAGLPAGQTVLGADLARITDVPQNYLSKILHALNRAGIVRATRGSGGGYGLDRDPKGIRLVEVVEVFEGPRARLGCLLGKDLSCSDEQPCSAHARWREIRNSYMTFMEEATLEEIAGSQAETRTKSGTRSGRGLAPRVPKRAPEQRGRARSGRGSGTRRGKA